VFRTIQRLMFVDIVGGIALALLGLFVLDFPAMTIGGIFLAGMGVGLVLLFGRMARRAAGRAAHTRCGVDRRVGAKTRVRPSR
jgi:hypothetical protein